MKIFRTALVLIGGIFAATFALVSMTGLDLSLPVNQVGFVLTFAFIAFVIWRLLRIVWQLDA